MCDNGKNTRTEEAGISTRSPMPGAPVTAPTAATTPPSQTRHPPRWHSSPTTVQNASLRAGPHRLGHIVIHP
jgi:hypothetical protein